MELVVVLALIGTLAVLALPAMDDRSAVQARGFAEELRAMLRHGRAVAVAQQRDVCVLLTPTQALAVYHGGAGCDAAAPLRLPGEPGAFVVPVPAGVALGGVTQVHFNAAGQPVPNVDHTIVAGAQTLTVSRETGITP